jgi:hypothetical protein
MNAFAQHSCQQLEAMVVSASPRAGSLPEEASLHREKRRPEETLDAPRGPRGARSEGSGA